MSDLMKEGEAIKETADDQRSRLKGKAVRVVRVLEYVGEGSAVLDQLARSLPIGVKVFDNRRYSMSITVAQGEIEVLGSAGPPPFWLAPQAEVCRVDPEGPAGWEMVLDRVSQERIAPGTRSTRYDDPDGQVAHFLFPEGWVVHVPLADDLPTRICKLVAP